MEKGKAYKNCELILDGDFFDEKIIKRGKGIIIQNEYNF